MSKVDRKNDAIKATISLYTAEGDTHLSMRNVASQIGIAQSVLYHHFKDRESLLKEAFEYSIKELGRLRASLPENPTVKEMFRSRIRFQLDNTSLIMFILRYYTEHRSQFGSRKSGFLPPKSALHIEEVLLRGEVDGVYRYKSLEADAKVIAHSINGFVTEYHGRNITSHRKDRIVEEIAGFFERALLTI